MKKVRAFYFAKQNNRLCYDDNRLVRVGVTHSVDCKPECCKQGLHASRNVFDALGYASSHKLYLVDIWGDIHEQEDKLCGTHRKYIARFDTNDLLRKFARQQALINIEKIKPYTDEYELIIRYLETGGKSIKSAAESAAWYAARSAARSAASDELQRLILEATGWELREGKDG